nr:hypothetical protein [uncultured Methylotenera sp.]
MSEFQEYPKMLYRPGSEKSQDIWGYRLDTLTVTSYAKEHAAVRDGWHVDVNKAINLYIRKQKLLGICRSISGFYLRNWQWLWGSLLAIILAVLFGG